MLLLQGGRLFLAGSPLLLSWRLCDARHASTVLADLFVDVFQVARCPGTLGIQKKMIFKCLSCFSVQSASWLAAAPFQSSPLTKSLQVTCWPAAHPSLPSEMNLGSSYICAGASRCVSGTRRTRGSPNVRACQLMHIEIWSITDFIAQTNA